MKKDEFSVVVAAGVSSDVLLDGRVPACLRLAQVFDAGMEGAVYGALDALGLDGLLVYGDGSVRRYLAARPCGRFSEREFSLCGEGVAK